MKKDRIIITDHQLLNCVNSKVDVEVWVAGIFDCLSKIIGYNDVAVIVEDGQYLRDNCVIKARGNYFSVVERG